MCFSASASFASAAIVGAAGIASLGVTKRIEDKPFACFPLVFAIQQLVEGFVWLSFKNPIIPEWQSITIKTFLFFATVLWPLFVPFSVWKMEGDLHRKKILFGIFLTGVVFAAGSLSFLIIYPSNANINEYHVFYELDYPLQNSYLVSVLYLITTVISLLISTQKWVPVLGVLIFGSYIITRFYFKDHVISVWCFFAAIMSVIIYLILSHKIKGT